MYPIDKIRKNFPILNKNIIYLDNAASTQKPIFIIKNELYIYNNYYSSYNKGLYDSSIKITNDVENSRKSVSNFINSNYKEIIFTKNSTESINFIANSWGNKFIKKGDNIIISEIEHHANILPWIKISKSINFNIKILKINIKSGCFNIDQLYNLIDNKTKLVSITHISNILGIINDIKKISNIIKEKNKKTLILIDGSQSISKLKIDVKKIKCDFYVFSGHKMYSSLGVGILYIRKKILEKIEPWQLGGGIVKKFNIEKKYIEYIDYPWKFETGTINFISIIGLKKSINYINKIGISKIYDWEKKLTIFSMENLKKINNIILYCKNYSNKLSIISFNIKNINPNDLSILLNREKICIRSGNHCSIPTMNIYKVNQMCRISYAMYTNYDDIIYFIDKLKYILKKFF